MYMKVYNLQVAMLRSLIGRLLPAVWIFLLIFGFYPLPAISGGLPSEGSLLPQFRLDAPSSEQERAYLGIGDVKTFSINQIDAPYTLIEIMSVYCPQCHEQAPLFNKLFYRIKKNGKIAKKVKMMAVAIGANPTEVNYVKKEIRIPFPIVKDPLFEIHKVLGEPRTPFTMLVTREGKVLFAHLGVIEDIDKFLLQIGKLTQ